MNFKKQFEEGLLTKNPVTVQLLGMCSTLAITTSLFNGIGMGVAVTIILICSNVLSQVTSVNGTSVGVVSFCPHAVKRKRIARISDKNLILISVSS